MIFFKDFPAKAHIRHRVQAEKQQLQQEIRQRVVGYVLGAFGLVAAIAWNEAVQALIGAIFRLNRQTVLAKFIYAGVVTLILVIVSVYLVRVFTEKKQEEGKKQEEKKDLT